MLMWNHYRIRPAYASPEMARASCRHHRFSRTLPFHALKASHSIPWPVETIGDCTLPTRQRDPRRETGTFHYVDIASINRDTKRIEDAKEMASEEAPSRARKDIRVNDILVSTVRPNLNAVAQVTQELHGQIASTGFAVLRPNTSKIHPRYLFFRVISDPFISDMIAQAKGAGYPAVSDRIVGEHELPLPPLPEQDRIVEILDQADALRQQRRQADALSQRILPALFHEMFGDVVGNSKAWPVSTIANCTDSRLGKMLDRGKDEEADPQPYLANLNVRWGSFDLDDLRTMDFSEADRREFELLPGDVLICEGGEVGRSAIWRQLNSGIYFQKALHRVRVNPTKLTPEYFQFYMHSMAGNGGLAQHVGAAVIGHLTGVKLKQLVIPLPPIDLQRIFSAAYVAQEQLAIRSSTSAATLETLFQTLLHRAFDGSLTAKWRVGHAKEVLQEMENKNRPKS
jgi:type I restriction enzyme S subunit